MKLTWERQKIENKRQLGIGNCVPLPIDGLIDDDHSGFEFMSLFCFCILLLVYRFSAVQDGSKSVSPMYSVRFFPNLFPNTLIYIQTRVFKD